MADSRFSEQCILIDYIDLIALTGFMTNLQGYSNFKIIDCDSNKGGGAYNIISKLTSNDGVDDFLNLPPSALATLIPKIKLFKEVYKGNRITGKPSDLVEFVFEDFYSKRNIDDIFGTTSFKRVGGAGLSEVSWVLNGKNPAEAGKVLEATLKFEFQTVADLLGDRFDPATGGIVGAGSLEGGIDYNYTANFVDLILHPPGRTDNFNKRAEQAKERGEYVPLFYRIRMDVGWAIPDLVDGTLPGLTLAETQRIKSELSRQNMSMILNLVSHEFDISENGKISLTVNYNGALEASMNSNHANVLNQFLRYNLGDEADKKEEIEDLRGKINELDEYIKCLNISNPREEDVELYEQWKTEIQTEFDSKTDNFDERQDRKRAGSYKEFLSMINKEVNTLVVSEEEIEEWQNSIDKGLPRPKLSGYSDLMNQDYLREQAKQQSGGFSAFAMAVLDWATGAPPKPGQGENADLANETISEAVENPDQVESTIEEFKDGAQDPEKGYIQFFYLGDIIAAAAETMKPINNPMAGDDTFILGPVVITHPRTGDKIHCNLADLPISYNEFQTFFFETIVRKQLTSYSISQFLRDIMERFVKRILQPSNCFPNNRQSRSIDVALTNFAISKKLSVAKGIRNYSMLPSDLPPKPADNPENIKKLSEWYSNKWNAEKPGRLYIESITEQELQELTIVESGDPVVNCLMFYMNSYLASELVGDIAFDRKNGIYHFWLGADTGIVKSIEYSRTDTEGLREARQSEAGNLGQIRDVYDANVKLVGNSLFLPGMKIFLHPPMAFGDPTADGYDPNGERLPDSIPSGYPSMANLLGIGGYYDIITVESGISRSGQYETTLTCKFAQSGGKQISETAKCDKTISLPDGYGSIGYQFDKFVKGVSDTFDMDNPDNPLTQFMRNTPDWD